MNIHIYDEIDAIHFGDGSVAQLLALMSGVVLGGVAEVVRISLEAKYLQHLSAQLIHYIPLHPGEPHV